MRDRVLSELEEEARSLRYAREALPLWVEGGLKDTSCALHSVGVAYWTVLGRSLGYSAICEMPAPVDGPCANIGDDVRNDSVWFPGSSPQPLVLVEFERYSGTSDAGRLSQKADNLLLAFHRWKQSPQILVLAYWTKGLVDLPDHAALLGRVRNGFDTRAKERVPGTSTAFVCIQFILRCDADSQWRLSEIIRRGV